MTLKIGWLHEAEKSLGTWLHEADDWHPRSRRRCSSSVIRPGSIVPEVWRAYGVLGGLNHAC